MAELRNPTAAYKDLSKEMQTYMSRVAAILTEKEIIVSGNIDKSSED